MMRLLYTAVETQQATLPAVDRPQAAGLVEAMSTAERQKIWLVVDNVSPHLMQILDEEGSVLAILWPWQHKIVRLRPANEGYVVMFHWVSKLSTFAGTAQGIFVELTTVEPVPPSSAIGT